MTAAFSPRASAVPPMCADSAPRAPRKGTANAAS
jgi:hypothetical protein